MISPSTVDQELAIRIVLPHIDSDPRRCWTALNDVCQRGVPSALAVLMATRNGTAVKPPVSKRNASCPHSHEYTPENTIIDKRGRIYCRACKKRYIVAILSRVHETRTALSTGNGIDQPSPPITASIGVAERWLNHEPSPHPRAFAGSAEVLTVLINPAAPRRPNVANCGQAVMYAGAIRCAFHHVHAQKEQGGGERAGKGLRPADRVRLSTR